MAVVLPCSQIDFCHTVPVKYSPGGRRDWVEPAGRIFMANLLMLMKILADPGKVRDTKPAACPYREQAFPTL